MPLKNTKRLTASRKGQRHHDGSTIFRNFATLKRINIFF